MKKDILNINVFNGDDGIKYIKYDDMISMLNRIKEDNEERDKEIERLNNIIKEAINYIDDNTYYKDHKGHINIDDLYIILQGSDKECMNS